MTDPSVSIVVVNYNGAAFIDEFAASLAAVDYPDRRLFIVDNASRDGSRERLKTLFPEADVVLNERNLGLAPAINQALNRCLDGKTDFVLLLNSDTELPPEFLRKLVSTADKRTILVPKVLNYFDRSLINTHAGGFDWTRGVFSGTYDGQPDGPQTSGRREVETASFCCMLVPASAFRDAGFMDERLCMYYEDTDFAERCRKAGYRLVFEPSSFIFHREGGSGGGKESPFKHYYATRNRPYVVRKHVGAPRYLVFTLYFLTTRFGRIVRYALQRDWPLLRAQVLAVRDYYTGRMGMTYTPQDLIGR